MHITEHQRRRDDATDALVHALEALRAWPSRPEHAALFVAIAGAHLSHLVDGDQLDALTAKVLDTVTAERKPGAR